jgi:hypothetical protein
MRWLAQAASQLAYLLEPTPAALRDKDHGNIYRVFGQEISLFRHVTVSVILYACMCSTPNGLQDRAVVLHRGRIRHALPRTRAKWPLLPVEFSKMYLYYVVASVL